MTRHGKHTGDPELWSPDLAFFLCDAPGLLGERGAGLEPSGSSSLTFDRHTDQQLGGFWGRTEEARRSGAAPLEGHAARAYRLRARWREQRREHRATHLSHYLGRHQVPATVTARLGLFAGVVVAQFEARYWRKVESQYAKAIDAARDKLEGILAELEPYDDQLRALERQIEHDRQSGYILQRIERKELKELRNATMLEAQPLRTKRSALLVQLADLDRATQTGDPTRALLTACQRGEQPALTTAAERAIRAAHRAWTGVGSVEAAEAILDGVQ